MNCDGSIDLLRYMLLTCAWILGTRCRSLFGLVTRVANSTFQRNPARLGVLEEVLLYHIV